ncbi:MAG TPA: D-aminoacyl-tRNA deacylase, partial [Bacillota bacterium]|nr:D-aminoacyl-tRNA deacylase [Bacillota bacterium]
MKAVLQRVHRAEVSAGGQVVGRCGAGLMIAVGIAVDDTDADVRTLVDKICKLRIFRDDAGKLNLSVRDIDG